MAIWARHAWLSCVAASWWAGVLGADSQRREMGVVWQTPSLEVAM